MAPQLKPRNVLKHNERHCKLSENMKKVTCGSSPGGKSPEVTPCYSRQLRTNYLLGFYCSAKANKKTARKSTEIPMAADGGIPQPAKKLTRSIGDCAEHTSSHKRRTVFHVILVAYVCSLLYSDLI